MTDHSITRSAMSFSCYIFANRKKIHVSDFITKNCTISDRFEPSLYVFIEPNITA